MGTPKVNVCKLNCITDVMTKEAWMAAVSPWGRVSCGGHECRAGRGCCGLGSQGMVPPGNGSVHSPEEASAVGVLPALGWGRAHGSEQVRAGVRLGISTHFLWAVLPLVFDGPLSLAGHSSKRPQRGGSPHPSGPCPHWHEPGTAEPPALGPAAGTFGSQSHGGGSSSNVAATFSDATNHPLSLGGCTVRVRLTV